MFKSDKVNHLFCSRRLRWQSTLPLLLAGGLALGTAHAQDPVQESPQDCSSDPYVQVKVLFNGSCPERVSVPDINVCKAKKREIVWTAHDVADPDGEPVDVEFSIFFDPFKNSSLESGKGNPKNQITSPKLGDVEAIPLATYKYTIVGTGCEDKPHDPRITVR